MIDLTDFTSNIQNFNGKIVLLLGFGIAISVTIWGYNKIKQIFFGLSFIKAGPGGKGAMIMGKVRQRFSR